MGFMRLKAFVSFLIVVVLLAESAHPQALATWQTEAVDLGRRDEARSFSSLIIDRFGNFHFAYSNRSGNILRYAFRSKQEKRWDTATVDPAGGRFESLAVDSHGLAHIAYNSANLLGLHYAFWDGKQWHRSLIDSARTDRETSIQLDSLGHPHISYFREEYADRRNAKYLKYAYFDGETWYIQTIDHRLGSGRWSSIALDRDDRPYVSYSVAATSGLGFAYLTQSTWEHTVADSHSAKDKTHLDTDSSLALGAGGKPHIAFVNAAARTINYAWQQGADWHQEVVESLVSTGADADRVSLKLDKGGRPRAVYYDSGSGSLKYATRDEQGWHTETIEIGDAGEYVSLCLDENDQPYVSYYAATDRKLHIAHRPSSVSVQK